ncbi:MAG: winged helix-turn-helix transcriptional regulator [Pseudonocardiaceae bacterium]
MEDEEFVRHLYNVLRLCREKWVPAILVGLSAGPLRRGDILDTLRSHSLPGEWSEKNTQLHDSVLETTLKMLTAAGMLARQEYPNTFPPKVIYRLTPAARSAVEAMRPMAAWARDHPEVIGRAQRYKRGRVGPDPAAGQVIGDTVWSGRAG